MPINPTEGDCIIKVNNIVIEEQYRHITSDKAANTMFEGDLVNRTPSVNKYIDMELKYQGIAYM
jgi:hypothetical protein